MYRDNGLAIFENKSGLMLEKIKKNFQKTFKDHGLQIVIENNQKIVNFLDATLNLNGDTHRPYHKPDSNTQYINIESNHPPCIVKQLSLSIEKIISALSFNESIFKQSKPYYENLLAQSGYKHELE